MASPKTPDPEKKSEGLADLGKLLENALARHGVSARSIAQRAGIGASHLSKVLKAKRSLQRAKLEVLSDLLGLDKDKVLRLAGFGRSETPRVDLGRVTLLRTLEKMTLNVVVTPRFYDAALFMWLLNNQPLAEVGVECQLRRAEWSNVPAELASYTYSVGFHNQASALYRVSRWNHLCLDKSHAVVARGTGAAQGKSAWEAYLNHAKKRGKRLLCIGIDSSMVDHVRNAAGLGDDFDVQIIPNPDVALESFRAGAGDLFLGGLPQRIALRKGEFRELIVQGKEFPRLYSLQSLVCSEQMIAEKRPLLHAIEGLWFDACRRLYADASFRSVVFHEITEIVERHGIEKHSLVKEDFETLFTETGRDFEIFAQTPAQLWEAEGQLLGLVR